MHWRSNSGDLWYQALKPSNAVSVTNFSRHFRTFPYCISITSASVQARNRGRNQGPPPQAHALLVSPALVPRASLVLARPRSSSHQTANNSDDERPANSDQRTTRTANSTRTARSMERTPRRPQTAQRSAALRFATSDRQMLPTMNKMARPGFDSSASSFHGSFEPDSSKQRSDIQFGYRSMLTFGSLRRSRFIWSPAPGASPVYFRHVWMMSGV